MSQFERLLMNHTSNRHALLFGLLSVCGPLAASAQSNDSRTAVVLTGHDLTVDEVVRVARGLASVRVDPSVMARVERSHRLLLLAAKNGQPIYGLNRGVGIDRDKQVFRAGALDPDVQRASERFNRDLIRSHSAAVGPDAPEEVVRAALLARLNTMLYGATGARPAVAEMYVEMLNRRIHPVLPSRGSIGEADIGTLAHVGLAMMGEGDVTFDGRRMNAGVAFRQAGITPLVPFAKDGLSILSSNAYAAGIAALVVSDVNKLLDQGEVVAALALEGLNGNVAPLLEPVQRVRPYPSQMAAAARMRLALEGSYLWQPDARRSLQDPLSFRTASQVYGTAREQAAALEQAITTQLNASDDNPAVLLDVAPGSETPAAVRPFYMQEGDLFGAVIPTANFEPVAWASRAEALSVALARVSAASAQRSVRLQSASFTGLRMLLAPSDSAIGLEVVQLPVLVLDAEIRELSAPVRADASSAAGGQEDVASNAAANVERTAHIVDDLCYVIGVELLHAAQAVDLRRRAARTSIPTAAPALGRGTGELFDAFRQDVGFLDRDRVQTDDIRKTYEFLRRRGGIGTSR
jgi:histidine ammonia-lyase